MTIEYFPLPSDNGPTQPFVSISMIPAGYLSLPDFLVYADAAESTTARITPSFSFLIRHQALKRNLLFDLGLRKDSAGYPPSVQKSLSMFSPQVEFDVADILEQNQEDPASIDTIIFSHLHWDHTGDISLFPNAQVILGPGSQELIEKGYPINSEAMVHAFPSDRQVQVLSFENSFPLGSFARAIDFFHDGSLYLLDAPGHMPGHICALARIAPEEFVLLGGDACHATDSYTTDRKISPSNNFDYEVASNTVERLRKMNQEGVEIFIAHDETRLKQKGIYPESL